MRSQLDVTATVTVTATPMVTVQAQLTLTSYTYRSFSSSGVGFSISCIARRINTLCHALKGDAYNEPQHSPTFLKAFMIDCYQLLTGGVHHCLQAWTGMGPDIASIRLLLSMHNTHCSSALSPGAFKALKAQQQLTHQCCASTTAPAAMCWCVFYQMHMLIAA